MRETFVSATTALLDEDPRTALVLAEISADAFAPARQRHRDRVINVGIREALMASVAGGLALTGMRPFLHSYAPFAVDRAYEQLKLDLGHQDVGAVVVTIGGSYDASAEGYTHQSPGDVALLDTLEGWTVHVPGHRDEVPALLRRAAGTDDRVYVRLSVTENAHAHAPVDELQVIRRGTADAPLLVAVGPMLDPALAATEGRDITVAYTLTPRPLDAGGLRELVHRDLIMVEPYLSGTSSRQVAEALSDRPHRALYLGVGREEVRRYGTPADHAHVHGLDAEGIRAAIERF